MTNLINNIRALPGKSIITKAMYVAWKLLGRRLKATRVIFRNGEVIPRPPDTSISCAEIRKVMPRIICVTGFGHSGSGVVSDLLSEYEGVTVQGFVDGNGSLRRTAGLEFDILRHAGGLFDLEMAVMSCNPFFQDATVKSFMALVSDYYYNPKCFYRESLLSSAKMFLKEIIDYTCPTNNGFEYNPHLKMIGDRGFALFYADSVDSQAIFSLRKMSKGEYRSHARDFLWRILPCMTSTEYLLLDQIVSDCSADLPRYKEYLGPLKLIAVYRDPRDVFVTGINLKEHWIPHNANDFVLWYMRQLERYFELKDDDFLLLRFEDLVLQYSNAVATIEKFIGIDACRHKSPCGAFDPKISVKNIGIHRTADFEKEKSIIASQLSKFCFVR